MAGDAVATAQNDDVVTTVCPMCHQGCGVNVTLKDGRIDKVTGLKSHPNSKGVVCARAGNADKWVHHPDRIKYPMKKVNGSWERISWDEALDTIAARLRPIKEQFGAKSLAVIFGYPVLVEGTSTISFIRRFCDAFGTPSVFSVDAMCWRSRLVGSILTFGNYAVQDLDESKCIFVWAHNPHQSEQTVGRQILEAQKKGAKVVVIDPRRTQTAKKADIHVMIRPGTDGALLLAFMHVIITEGLYDKAFVEKWTYGFDKLKLHVDSFTPEWAEKITWIPANQIKDLARMYASIKPATILSPHNAIEESGNAVQNHRAISILQAITGNFGVPGGDIVLSGVRRSPIRLEEMLNEKPLGCDIYPLFHSVWGRLLGEGEGQTMLVPDAILAGEPYPIKAAIVSSSNPLLSWPNSAKVRQAFEKLDFLVVMEMFETDTTRLADIVLPGATGFERQDIFDFYNVLFGLPWAMLRKKVLQVGECWSAMKFYLELAKRMGFEEYFPWKNTDEVIDYMFEPSGLSIGKMAEGPPEGMPLGKKKYKDHEGRGYFYTPSKKVEIYSETLAELGHDPLPTYKEPPESPISTPELFREYPIILTTGARAAPVHGSAYRNIDKLRNAAKGAVAEIHPDTAAEYGIGDGDMMVVENKRGKIEIAAAVADDILPGVIAITHGWSANVNLLTDNSPADPITGFPSMRALLCRIRKK
ncbi:MAG: molybdopterin-dependent oxidoreductase [Desulfobacterales bacterium]|jgi:anaerobic selenocysteine-containing dehydrogenase|nr:molybdopterin-dependent oxidoreductase [Desulfobacterales bacterium]